MPNPPETAARRRPLLCRLGLHETYLDAAFFTHARRCARCGDYSDKHQARELARERDAWSQVPEGLSSDEKLGWVARRVAEGAQHDLTT